MKDIQSRSSELDGIFDVKVDVHKFSILGIYRRECTEITARGFSLRTQGQ
jgi:hypothetical protein